MKYRILIRIIWIIIFLNVIPISAQVKLPRLISDGMVLQRNAKVKIWGWASPGETISLNFLNIEYKCNANGFGLWEIFLNNHNEGGPFEMTIKASNTIVISDILIGDVWICSGQSNMELPVKRVSWNYEDELVNCDNNAIRQFKVPQGYNFNFRNSDYNSGSWKVVNRENIEDFSAVAYFFAKELYSTYKVPIGLINNALGGSPAEAWMSEEALKLFPEYFSEMQRFKDSTLIQKIINSDNERISGWYYELNKKDLGYKNKDSIWKMPDIDTRDWNITEVPGYWKGNRLESVNGVVWYRRNFNIDNSMAEIPALLELGRIIDADSVFVNGKFVGATSYQYPHRRYEIPHGILHEGKNCIVVRVINNQGTGGFIPDKPYKLTSKNGNVDLSGKWQYKIGTVMEPLSSQTFIRWRPGGLFNYMIAPSLNYCIKGVIWYQGESNTGRPEEYRKLFPALIKDWRDNWNQGDFPFIYVQLANFMETNNVPSESNWAMLRESQTMALSVSNTAMAVAIDIGEWNDVHPLNKKDVGYRLSLAAQKIAYKEADVLCSGPVYKSMEIEGNKVTLSFSETGSGLKFKNNNSVMSFAIAGKDRNFIWAESEIKENKVIVWNDNISLPVAVRYAWADNPVNASLYNLEGLPASPFRTDNWNNAK